MIPLVAIPVKNRLDLTKPLVEAIEKDNDCNVLILDNGSDDGTREWATGRDSSRPSTRGYHDCRDMTLHQMWNLAIDRAVHVSEFVPVVLLNNDLVLDGKPKWVTRLCAPFSDKAVEWDALCPNYDKSPVLSWRPVIRLRGVQKLRLDGTGGLAGFAFALSPRFLKTGYRFPETLKWWYGDNDLVMRLDAEGRPYGMVADVGVEHIGGGSQTAKDYPMDAIKAADLAVFEDAWGVML